MVGINLVARILILVGQVNIKSQVFSGHMAGKVVHECPCCPYGSYSPWRGVGRVGLIAIDQRASRLYQFTSYVV